MNEVRESCNKVVDAARHVTINDTALRLFADGLRSSDLQQSEFGTELATLSESERIAFVVVFEAICFSFWGDPKWAIEINNYSYDGSKAMLHALLYAHAKHVNIFDATYLASLSKQDFSSIFSGNVELPLANERRAMLRRVGSYFSEHWRGSYTDFIENAKWHAPTIARQLASELPEVFNDQARYNNTPVHFYKRAQLVPAKLQDLYETGQLHHPIHDVGLLTGFADYKIPQLLRSLRILAYDVGLATMIDTKSELESGSDEEVEIRAATIVALERITERVQERFPQATAAKVDTAIFLATQQKHSSDLPYHRTRTIWY